ncbi:hypothetical protein XELAEV_18008210mg [Xenopus laevis]|uniref:Uncharacterized protein n=1 Tax=Xenopus laevis TaxID=8355 RepID=A0A974E3A7_XENLA|nr:hypothetical protein XELAEV_18008210mg [Xenopus laevis]
MERITKIFLVIFFIFFLFSTKQFNIVDANENVTHMEDAITDAIENVTHMEDAITEATVTVTTPEVDEDDDYIDDDDAVTSVPHITPGIDFITEEDISDSEAIFRNAQFIFEDDDEDNEKEDNADESRSAFIPHVNATKDLAHDYIVKFKRMWNHPIMQLVFIACVTIGAVFGVLTVYLIKRCSSKCKKAGPKEAEEGKAGFVQNNGAPKEAEKGTTGCVQKEVGPKEAEEGKAGLVQNEVGPKEAEEGTTGFVQKKVKKQRKVKRQQEVK